MTQIRKYFLANCVYSYNKIAIRLMYDLYITFSKIVKSFLSLAFLSTQLKNYEIVTFAIRKIYTWN